jgi:glycerol-3-phosphate acyltransferase PlsY
MNVEIYEFLRNIGLILLCYLIGAILFCNVIAKIHSNKDLKKIGDKNPGGWNLVFNISKC